MRNLRILKYECERNKTTPEEVKFYQQFVGQVAASQQTVDYLNELLSAHVGDFEREIKKVLESYNIRLEAYHGSSLVGNHCMFMSQNGDHIMNDLVAVVLTRLSNPTNTSYLEAVSIRMEKILNCGLKSRKQLSRQNIRTTMLVTRSTQIPKL